MSYTTFAGGLATVGRTCNSGKDWGGGEGVDVLFWIQSKYSQLGILHTDKTNQCQQWWATDTKEKWN